MENNEIKVVGKYRTMTGFRKWVFISGTTLSVVLSIIYMFTIVIAGHAIPWQAYLAAMLGIFLSLAFILYPATLKSPRETVPWYDICLALLSLAGPIAICVVAEKIPHVGWEVMPPLWGVILAVLTWVLLIEASRRTAGVSFTLIIAVLSVYPFFASYMPGILLAKSYSITRMSGFYLFGSNGIFGLPMQVFSQVVIGYLIFGVVLQVTGGAAFFLDLAMSLLGHIRGGGAKVAIFASTLFATMSGSAVSNVLTTGAMTIPTMKKTGYPPYYAAAIEACASTGGVLTPPVMGATAFIMADFLRIPYYKVCLAACLPAVLFYAALFIQADLYAAKSGLGGMSKDECPSFAATLKKGWFYVFALMILVYYLFWERTVGNAPFYGCIALIICSYFRKETRFTFQSFIRTMEGTGKVFAELTAILGAIGMVIGALTLTGFAQALSREVVELVGADMGLLLVLGAFVSFILGMGLTVTACYIFLAMLVAPMLIQVGIYPVAAHLFFLYWGMASYITPPVALASFAAAGLAGSKPMYTGFQSMRLGIVLLLVPFCFVLNPALVFHGSSADILFSMVRTLIGIVFLSSGIEGYLWKINRINWNLRIPFMLSGLFLFIPFLRLNMIGVIIIAASFLFHFFRRRLKPAA